MNKRIEELMTQASTIRYSGFGDTEILDPKKFAELIVRECVSRIKLQQQMDEVTEDWVYTNLQEDLREYFGVE